MDDDDEVLVVWAEQLGTFAQYLGGPDYAHMLLKSLEGLASADEPIVREAVLAQPGIAMPEPVRDSVGLGVPGEALWGL